MDTPLQDANPTHYLKRVDRDTPPLQFVRELVQNGIEAEATSIILQPLELQLDTENGEGITVEKFMVMDNGEGMTPEKMFNNLAKMNSSSKSSNSEHHENFGIGAKITTAMWNPHGVVFCSWHKDDPDNGHLVWLHYNKDFNQICLKGISMEYAIDDGEGGVDIEEEYLTTLINGRRENVIPLLDEDGDPYRICEIDFNQLRPKSGHGTVVILLGESMQDNTWTDSNKKPLTNRSLRYYLNTRYASVPDTVRIGEAGRRAGRIKGFNESLNTLEDNFVLSRDIVKCPNGFKVEVVITKDHGEWYKAYKENRGITGNASPVNDNFMQADFNKGFVALQYETKHGTHEFYNIEKGAKVLYQWGISAKSLVGRVKLIVHPPQYNGVRGVYPNEGRYRLQWMDNEAQLSSNEIDLTEVKEYFVNHHPKALRDLIGEAYKNYVAKGVDLDKVFGRYGDIIKPKKNANGAYEFDENGNLLFEPEKEKRESKGNHGSHGQGNGGSKKAQSGTKQGGSVKGKVRKGKAQKPIVGRWLTYKPHCENNVTDAFEENGIEYPIFIEEVDGKYVVNMMKNHPLFVSIISHFHGKKKTLTVKVVEETVKEQHIGYFSAYIRHLEGTKIKNPRGYLSLQALHGKMLGAYELWDRISNALGFVGK